MLEKLDASVLASDVHLFQPRETVLFYEQRALPSPGAGKFAGPNPPYGVLITYYLKDNPPEEKAQGKEEEESPESPAGVKIVILDAEGNVIRELTGPDRRGFNRVNWDLRYSLLFEPKKGDEGWFGPHKGPFVLPGEYTVKLIARGQELTRQVKVIIDPQARTTMEDLQARHEAGLAARELQRAFKDAQKMVDKINSEVKKAEKELAKKSEIPEDVSHLLKDVKKKLKKLTKAFSSGWDGPEFEVMDLAGQLQASTSRPTEAQLRLLEQLTQKVTTNIGKLNTFIQQDYANFRNKLKDIGVGEIRIKPVQPPRKN
jgi:hypothetical protein